MSKRDKSAKSQPAGVTPAAPKRATPHRPVVGVALMVFVPSLWLVLHGNLSVQTALFRFIGALLVSWVAVQIVLATMSSFARPASPGKTPASAGSSDSAGVAGSPDAAEAAGRGGPSGAASGSTRQPGSAGRRSEDAPR